VPKICGYESLILKSKNQNARRFFSLPEFQQEVGKTIAVPAIFTEAFNRQIYWKPKQQEILDIQIPNKGLKVLISNSKKPNFHPM